MAGDRRKDLSAIQAEVNRQALVEISTRLTILEQQIMLLDSEARDLKFFVDNSNETSKKLQILVKGLLAKQAAARQD